MVKPDKADPHNIRPRLLRQVAALLTQLETGAHITLRERVQALVAIGRIEQIFVALKKAEPDDTGRGTVIRKYETAFADAVGRRAAHAGPAGSPAVTEPDDSWFEPDAESDADDPA